LAPKLIVATGQIEPELPITDSKSKFYTEHNGKGDKRSAPPYNVEVFKDIGRAFLIAILDFKKINPVSRIPQSYYKNLDGVKADLVSKGNIFLPTKEAKEKQPREQTAKFQRKKLPPKKTVQRTQSSAPRTKPTNYKII
jgi:hypothetical protein